ncbi:MAG: thiamine ABC transporter substrate-binding protein [Bdellovibrionales bacterium]|nr:thiamine ABC transporter substrate-binding protein [Bdellovibrionales bacterium]
MIPSILWVLTALPVSAQAGPCQVKVLVYDSLVAKDGLFPVLKSAFQKKENCELVAQSVGDGGQLLARLQSSRTDADAVIGLDQSNLGLVRAKLHGQKATAYDQSPMVWVGNREEFEKRKLPIPKRILDLTTEPYQRQLLLQDPRGSTPGLIHLLFLSRKITDSQQLRAFLKKIRTNVLALTPGWSASYSLFKKNQAPMVWTYLSSVAYHREKDGPAGEKYFPVYLDEGAPVQVEYAAVLKDSPKAQALIQMLISAEIQAEIPKRNWMFPIKRDITLPESFSNLVQPKPLDNLEDTRLDLIRLLKIWEEAIR